MNTSKRRFQVGILSACCAVLVLVGGPGPLSNPSAQAEWLVLGNTMWVSGDPTLTLTMPYVSQPSLSVMSSAPGDLKWIALSIPFALGRTIDGVYLCYKAPNAGTYISQIRLAEFVGPTTAFVKHDDPTDLTSATDICYYSPVSGGYTPGGAVNLELRLNFASSSHVIWIGGVAMQLSGSPF